MWCLLSFGNHKTKINKYLNKAMAYIYKFKSGVIFRDHKYINK